MYKFLDCFSESYKRSQADSTKKVVRCFPECRSMGHRPNGFCGTSVLVEGHGDNPDVFYWGTFTTVNKQMVQKGDQLPSNFFDCEENPKPKDIVWYPAQRKIRSTENTNKSWIKFSPRDSSWLYTWWSSSKTASKLMHCFIVIGCKKVKDSWIVMVVERSPGFRIHSKALAKKLEIEKQNSTDKIEELLDEVEVPRKRIKVNETLESNNTVNAAQPDTSSIFNKLQTGIRNFIYNRESVIRALSKATLSVEEQQNLTFDRLKLLFFSPKRFNAYRRELAANLEMASHLQKIENIFDDAMIFMRNSNRLSAVINEWADPAKETQFSKRCKYEISRNFVWTPQREYETYEPDVSLEQSIYAQFRNVYRRKFKLAMEMNDADVSVFFDVMAFLSSAGIIVEDPFHPPSVEEGRQIHFKIHGQSPYNPIDYAAGEDVFSTMDQQEMYAKDLLIVQRSRAQIKVCDRVDETLFANRLRNDPNSKPLDPSLDISGVWVNTAQFEPNDEFPGVTGRLAGVNVSRLLRYALSKPTIEHTSTSLIIRALPVCSFCVNYCYISDGLPHPSSPNHPLTDLANWIGIKTNQKRQYIMFSIPETKMSHLWIDYDICITKERSRELYPRLDWSKSDPMMKIYRMASFTKTSADQLEMTTWDYFFPLEKNVWSIDFAKEMVREGQQCPYLAERATSTYVRFVMAPGTASETLQLLL